MSKVLRVNDLKIYYPVSQGIRALFSKSKKWFKAVDGVTFDVYRKEIFCLVGESGSGKTTIGRSLLKLVNPYAGKLQFQDIDITQIADEKELKNLRKKMRMIFQDPYESLNMRQNVFEIVAEPLDIFKEYKALEEKREVVFEALESVGLSPAKDFSQKYPHQLSGGQRQRVSLAAACILQPTFIIADEPVSMLDMSVRVGILKLFLELRERFNLSFLFITHDLSIAWIIADRIAVMYAGNIVEIGTADDVIHSPGHHYTKSLISVIPIPDPLLRERERIILKGEITESRDACDGCKFAPRCEAAQKKCFSDPPNLHEIKPGHYVLCHFPNF